MLERLAPGDPLMIWWLAQVEAYGGCDAERCAAFGQVARMRAGFLSDLSKSPAGRSSANAAAFMTGSTGTRL